LNPIVWATVGRCRNSGSVRRREKMGAELSPETVMAYAIVDARRGNKPILIESVSGLFAKLRQADTGDVARVALRRLPHGLYSEDVEAFFGRLLAGGFAQAFSPLEVNEEGVKLCQELIDEESRAHPEALKRVAQVLGFDLSLIKNPTPQRQPV
jgi:hypothetical protein